VDVLPALPCRDGNQQQQPKMSSPALILIAFCLMQAHLASSIPKLFRFIHTKPRAISSMAQPGTFDTQMKDGWFTELSTMWPGQGMSLKIHEVIFKGRSDFQVHNFQMRRSQSSCTILYLFCIYMPTAL